jgi:uncharacterized protein (TIGR01777 family)
VPGRINLFFLLKNDIKILKYSVYKRIFKLNQNLFISLAVILNKNQASQAKKIISLSAFSIRDTLKTILLAGGSGLIGSYLSLKLKESGYRVVLLSRKQHLEQEASVFRWDPENEYIEPGALDDIDCIINLAGAGVGAHRWTRTYQEEILQSRVQAARTLYLHLKRSPGKVKKLINASATGFYPSGERLMHEEDKPGKDFLSDVCVQWEAEALRMEKLNIDVAIFRIGVVLSGQGGFLERMKKTTRLFLGTGLGNGRQHISWIHVDDLCRLFLLAVEKEDMTGIFNAVAPVSISNMDMTRSIARQLKRPVILPNAPVFALKWLFGDFSAELLADRRISARKIQEKGFVFGYPNPDAALHHLIGK